MRPHEFVGFSEIMMKQNRLTVLCLGVAFLGVFVVFSRQIKRGAMRQIDFDVTVKVQDRAAKLGNSNRIARFDSLMEDIGFFASPGFSTVAVAALTFWQFIDVKRKRIRLRALIIPIAFVFLVLVELYGKSVVTHPAPPFFMLKNPTTIFPTYHVWEEFSYPSGHAARATFLALLFVFLTIQQFNNRTISVKEKKNHMIVAVLVGMVYVGVVGVSRIYLGHHWFSDVIGGGMLGIASVLFVTALQ